MKEPSLERIFEKLVSVEEAVRRRKRRRWHSGQFLLTVALPLIFLWPQIGITFLVVGIAVLIDAW